MWKAKLKFWDGFEGEKFVVEIKAADKESLRKQWREELKAYVAEGYEFLGVDFEEVEE